jgi:hypothetical protein
VAVSLIPRNITGYGGVPSGGYPPQYRTAQQLTNAAAAGTMPGGMIPSGGPGPDTRIDPYFTKTPEANVPTFTTPGASGVDWTGLIGGSWEVSQAQAMMASQMARARANLQASLRQNFIDLGYTGGKSALGGLGSYIDKSTIQQAINNKYSVYAQTAREEAQANAGNEAELAARGILSSGQHTKSLQDVTNAAEQNRYMGLREFLRTGQTGLEHLGDVEAQMAQGVMQAQFAAAQRVAQENAAAAAAAAAASAARGPIYEGGAMTPYGEGYLAAHPYDPRTAPLGLDYLGRPIQGPSYDPATGMPLY